MPSYATAVPIIGGVSLILGALLACIVDTKLIRLETGNRVAPRYFSAAIADPKRSPYWAFFVGNLIYAFCLPLTAMWQRQMAGDLGVVYDGSPLFAGAVVTAFCALLFLFPMQSRKKEIQAVGMFLHTPVTFFWIIAAFRHAVECNNFTSALVDAGHGSTSVLAIREFLLDTLPVPLLLAGSVSFPLALYAQQRLEITWGRREGTAKIDQEKILLWSLLPFSLCLVQMIGGAVLGFSFMMCALEFASV